MYIETRSIVYGDTDPFEESVNRTRTAVKAGSAAGGTGDRGAGAQFISGLRVAGCMGNTFGELKMLQTV